MNGLKLLFWKSDIQLITLRSGLFPSYAVIISNVGYGTVVVTQMEIRWNNRNTVYHINQIIDNSKIYIHDEDVMKFMDSIGYSGFADSSSGVPIDDVKDATELQGGQTEAPDSCWGLSP
jgi:hypothetical protein